MIVAGADGAVDLEHVDHMLDAVALTMERLFMFDLHAAVWATRNDGFDPLFSRSVADRAQVVALAGSRSIGRALGKADWE